MRELTKSMLSLSWAMSLFGLKQMASMLTAGGNAAGSFEAVARCTEEQLGQVTRSTFRAGDNLQRGLVDMTFSLLTLGMWRPGAGGSAWGRGDMGGSSTAGCASCSATGTGPSAGANAVQAAGDLTAQAMGAGIDLMQQGVNAAYQMVGGGSAAQPRDTGWGPVPPPGFQMAGGSGPIR
ncbi:MAG TPA: hypothetical protein VIC28_13735 [Thermoanaerobaculia bacterium]